MRPTPQLLFAAALTSLPASVHSFAPPASFSNIAQVPSASAALEEPSTPTSQKSTILQLSADDIANADYPSSALSKSKKRRKFILSALVTPLAITSLPQSGNAASSSSSEKPPPIIPLITTARRLHAVPTFTIVDGNGVPFHTYDKDSAGGFGYFFTSYQSATYVLDDAQKAFGKAKTEAAAKKESGAIGEGGEGAIGEEGDTEVPDAWGQAQIVTIPLDIVMQLSVKKTSSIATNGKGKKFSTFYQAIPDTTDLNAALRIENGPRYSERGRVPLFYVDGLTIPSTEEEGAQSNPVYFRVKDLKEEWAKQNPDKDIPAIKVRELNETFRAMIRPGGKADESVRNLVFVPIAESVEKAKGVGRSYKLGTMILTK